MSQVFYVALGEVTRAGAKIKAAGGSVACWESVDYWCDGCPLLDACRAFERASGYEGVRCRDDAQSTTGETP